LFSAAERPVDDTSKIKEKIRLGSFTLDGARYAARANRANAPPQQHHLAQGIALGN
jgi:hypothetical protein